MVKRTMFFVLIYLVISLVGRPASGQTCSVCGYIEDSVTGEKLLGAHIFFNRISGTVSDDFGFYTDRAKINDTVQVEVSYVGYKTLITRLFVRKDTVVSFQLSPNLEMAQVTIIGHENAASVQSESISLNTLNPRFVENLPTLTGTPDILRSSQLLPGIQGGKEGSSPILIRGGSADQNLLLLDDVPVYYINHLGGFLSIFDAQVINTINIYKGGFPAKYGGRLSGVVDIRLKEGRKTDQRATLHLGLLSSEYKIEGPIRKDTSSYILSVRRCNLDVFTRLISLLDSQGQMMGGYTFYDMTAKVSRKLSWKDKVFFSVYGGRDKFFTNASMTAETLTEKYKSSLKSNWGNIITSFRWNHIYHPELSSNLTLAYSQFFNQRNMESVAKNLLSGDNIAEQRFHQASKIQDLILKYDFEYHSIPDHEIKFGLHNTLHFFKPYDYNRFDLLSDYEIDFSVKQTSPELRFYVEDRIKFNDRIFFNAGLHASFFHATEKSYWSLEPRVSSEFRLNPSSSIQLGYSRMTQNIHLISSSGVGLSTDLWIPSTNQIAPGKSDQLGISFHWKPEATIPIHCSVEAYYKKLHNLAELDENSVLFQSDFDLGSSIITGGEGTSKGIEVLIAKDAGRFTGWVSYTLSKHDRVFEELNGGKPFPFRYDRRHDVSTALMIPLSKNTSLSVTWVYRTGEAVTLASAEYLTPFVINEEINYGLAHAYGQKNGYRMPDYHRLDIGLNFKRSFIKADRKISIGILNVYNRRNPYILYWDKDAQGKAKLMQVSMFPIMPNISVTYFFK